MKKISIIVAGLLALTCTATAQDLPKVIAKAAKTVEKTFKGTKTVPVIENALKSGTKISNAATQKSLSAVKIPPPIKITHIQRQIVYQKIKLNRELLLAAQYGYIEKAQQLMERGADVNAAEPDGWTSLIYAARYDYPKFAEILIERGANVNAVDEYGYTALMYAERYGNTEIAELLKAHGAK